MVPPPPISLSNSPPPPPSPLPSPQLAGIDLSDNPFTPGPIPSELASLPLVGPLDLSRMNRNGSLVDLSKLSGVTDIFLGYNLLEGSIDPLLLPKGQLGFISGQPHCSVRSLVALHLH